MCLSLFLASLLTLVQLNCENLFDCRHDSLKQDTEFTPEGDRRWTARKYWDKLDNTAKAIIACGTEDGDWRLPDLVALCEVENDSVMRDLTRRSLLRNAGYEYIVTSSPDVRGIDVALLYSPASFAPVRHYPLRVEPVKGMRPTRDILYAAGRIITGDTLHIFVVHAPSRYGGERRTRPHRRLVADRLCLAIDSLHAASQDPMIVITGDFNDGGDSQIIRQICAKGLTDVSHAATGSHGARGTYKYKGRWESIDHIITSHAVARRLRSCTVNDAPFLLEADDRYGGVQPLRTYRAWRYRRGYSDHLPLVARFAFE